MSSEEEFMEHRVAIMPKRGAETSHSWMIINSDLPEEWSRSRPRAITRTWTDLKRDVVWTFSVTWPKSSPTAVLRVYR